MQGIAIPPHWTDLQFWTDPWHRVQSALDADPRPRAPADDRIFAALNALAPDDVRVIVLGQDPYPTPGHANGLAFSVTPETALPRSLANIYREMQADIGAHPATGDLSHLATQGVLLLNTALTVPLGDANGHAGIGWRDLVTDILMRLDDRPRALLLWGNHAQRVGASMHLPGHLRIETSHPSPLSARHSFFGSRPFSRINHWLAPGTPIDWAGRL